MRNSFAHFAHTELACDGMPDTFFSLLRHFYGMLSVTAKPFGGMIYERSEDCVRSAVESKTCDCHRFIGHLSAAVKKTDFARVLT